MSVPVCPDDFIVVKLETKYKDASTGGLFIDTGFNPGEHATVTGKVVSVPRGISNHFQKQHIVEEVLPGDEIAFSYRVVFNQRASDNAGDVFSEIPATNPYVTNWSNPNGVNIIRRYRGKGLFEAAVYKIENNKSVILEKTEGDSFFVTQWLKGVMPANCTQIEHNNCFVYMGKEYWKVDYPLAHAVFRDGKIKMIGGFALLQCPEGGIERDREYKGALEMIGAESMRISVRPELKAKLVAIGTPLKDKPKLSVKPGDMMVIANKIAQEYSFWGTPYILVRQDQLLAVA